MSATVTLKERILTMHLFHSIWRTLSQMLRDLVTYKPVWTSVTFGLMLLKNMSAGISFLMILPLLERMTRSNSTHLSPTHARLDSLLDYFHLQKTVGVILIFFTIVMSLTAGIAYLEHAATVLLHQRYHQSLRVRLQRALWYAQWSFLRSKKKSDLAQVLISETQHLAVCQHQLLSLINQLLLILVNTGIACWLSWSMTACAVGAAALLLLLMRPLHRQTLKAGLCHFQLNQSLHQEIQEQLQALKTIKGSGLEEQTANAFRRSGQQIADAHIQFNRMTAKSRLQYALCSAVMFSSLLYLAIDYFVVPFQQLILLFMVYGRMLPLISNTQQTYQRMLHQMPAYRHVMHLLQEAELFQEPVQQETLLFTNKITLRDVSFQYSDTSRFVFNQISFQLKKNTSTLLLGPSGVGKTTLVDVISGLYAPTKGHIFVDECCLTVQNRQAWRRQIAYLTQETILFNATIRENLSWFQASVSDAAIEQALALASAAFVYDLPEKLDTLIGDKGIELSGGERQRLVLARAILQQPSVLILDESTNALDEARVAVIQQSLAALKGLMTIVMISHQKIDTTAIDQVIRLSAYPVFEGEVCAASLLDS